MQKTLLDTDVLSEILKQKNLATVESGVRYLEEHGSFSFSAFTRFEIRRGFLERQAVRQLERFEEFCRHSRVLAVDDAIIDRACDLWALARKGGFPCGDADLIIAATAQVYNLELATGNSRHFAWIPQLVLVDWRSAIDQYRQ